MGYPEHFQSSQKIKIMKSIKESIIGRKGIQPSTNIISDCRDMISKIEHSPWKDAMEMATDYYDILIQNRYQYPREVQQIIDDSLKEWSGKALSKIARTDIMIQTIRSISNLAKKQRS